MATCGLFPHYFIKSEADKRSGVEPAFGSCSTFMRPKEASMQVKEANRWASKFEKTLSLSFDPKSNRFIVRSKNMSPAAAVSIKSDTITNCLLYGDNCGKIKKWSIDIKLQMQIQENCSWGQLTNCCRCLFFQLLLALGKMTRPGEESEWCSSKINTTNIRCHQCSVFFLKVAWKTLPLTSLTWPYLTLHVTWHVGVTDTFNADKGQPKLEKGKTTKVVFTDK